MPSTEGKKKPNRCTAFDIDPRLLLMNYLETLNAPQREAVAHGQGPLLILAGAGSGKTRVLTCRIAYLLATNQAQASEILAVTFTNKAAAEMRERVDGLLAGQSAEHGSPGPVTIATFHALGARLLRRHGRNLGLSWGFSILDDDDQRRLLRQVARDLDHDDDRRELARLAAFIDEMKNAGKTPTQAHEVAFSPHLEEDVHFYEAYQRMLTKIDAVDFGDLILKPLELFRADDDLARRYSRAWRFLMVDEFQDTNLAQYELLRHLTSTHTNLAVVGDDDQAIYRWRGATVANILGFGEDFPEARVVKLEQNYRSTQIILDAANDLIAHNTGRHDKQLWTEREDGEAITLFTAQSDREEASYVVEMIRHLLETGSALEDMAIFYRTNAQARLFEELLRHGGYPYVIVGGVSFFARQEIKDVLAYLRVALQPDNDVALLRVLNTPARGIGKTTIERLQAAAAVESIGSIHSALRLVVGEDEGPVQPDLFSRRGPRARSAEEAEAIAALDEIRGASVKGIAEFLNLVDTLRDDLEHFESLSTVVEQLIERTSYFVHLERTEPEAAEDKKRNVAELINAIEEFERDPELGALLEEARQMAEEASPWEIPSRAALTLGLFLDRTALVPRLDDDETTGAVTLMTVHGSKGLEFDTVFLVGMEDELFPSLRDPGDPEELAEERRLGYVAITRAQRRLYITNARRRRVYGTFRDTRPSRFLLEISPSRLRIDPRSAVAAIDYTRAHDGPRFPSPMEPGVDRRLWDFDQSPEMIKGHLQRALRERARKPDAVREQVDDLSQIDPRWEEDPVWPAAQPEVVGWQPPRARNAEARNLEGSTVSHSKFGVGQVLRVSGEGDAARLVVDFPGFGEQTVLRKYLKVMG
jgi:DNA helicase II / ATP-dependent DNA helicase PcrA